jgi:hypothetical protein
VGVNREIVRQGVNGYLAASENEWTAALTRLIESEALRRELGARGREIAVADYSLAAWAPRYLDVLERVARAAGRRQPRRLDPAPALARTGSARAGERRTGSDAGRGSELAGEQ